MGKLKKYINFVKENHKDIDPYGEEDWSEKNLNPIDHIKDIVNKYGGCITMRDLQADASPVYQKWGNEIHLIERLYKNHIEVVTYGGHEYETELDEYNITYEDLKPDIIDEIKNMLDDAIENDTLLILID